MDYLVHSCYCFDFYIQIFCSCSCNFLFKQFWFQCWAHSFKLNRDFPLRIYWRINTLTHFFMLWQCLVQHIIPAFWMNFLSVLLLLHVQCTCMCIYLPIKHSHGCLKFNQWICYRSEINICLITFFNLGLFSISFAF